MKVLHHFGSLFLANKVMLKLARQNGNGGKACFSVEECPKSSKPGNRIYRILFLTRVFHSKHPGVKVPSAQTMSGWIQGFL